MDEIEQLFDKVRSDFVTFTIENDEQLVEHYIQEERQKLDKDIYDCKRAAKAVRLEVQKNARVLTENDFNQYFYDGLYFSHEDFLQKLEKKQIDLRLKSEQAEAMQVKLDELDAKVQHSEDQNDHLRVKNHMKKKDLEQYQEMLRPLFNGQDIDVDEYERMKKEQIVLGGKFKEVIMHLQSIQRHANQDLKIARKR